MARYRDDDRDDRDDDRPRRRRGYDDGPPRKSNTGMILLIIGLAVGLPLLICGGLAVWGVMEAKKGINNIVTTAQSELAATSFLNTLEFGDVNGAYASTTPNFKSKMTLDQFDKLVKANPILTTTNTPTQSGFPTPTGTAPNRTVSLVYTVSPSRYGGTAPDPDPWATPTSRKVTPDPRATPTTAAAKGITCTITLVEQPDGTWKVDGFTVP